MCLSKYLCLPICVFICSLFVLSICLSISLHVCVHNYSYMPTYVLSTMCVHSRPSGTDKEFFVQLFVEPDKSMAMPTTEMLLTKMFKEQKITFAKVCTLYVLLVTF